jgi:haloacetate dehalogenase
MSLASFEAFRSTSVATQDGSIFARVAGQGPPLLLLHGFPQTHLMWREVAPGLARNFTVVCADLRGYGRSSCPPSDDEHTPYSKRTMASDMVCVMQAMGFDSFAVAGHDRGGRVAYRLALDHPARVTRIAVLDIVPTASVWERADARFAVAFWPWVLLAQDPPLPETMITTAPDALVDHALSSWGSSAWSFPADARAAYVEALRDPAHAHAICEEYRAAATLDRDHDLADRARGHRIGCPLFALWSAGGAVDTWYAEQGGALALWRDYAREVQGHRIDGGHFFPEQNPVQTLEALDGFFRTSP